MTDKITEIIKLLDTDIAALEQARDEAIRRANYLAGQVDAKKQMRDTLLAPADLPELDEAGGDEDQEQVEPGSTPAQAPAVPPSSGLTRKQERKQKAQERQRRSANGHSKEALPPPAGAV